MAIDREAITDKVLKTGELPAYGVVPPSTGDYGEPYEPEWADAVQGAPGQAKAAAGRRPGSGPTTRSSSSCPTTPARTTSGSPSRCRRCGRQIGVQAELVNREVKVHYDELKQHKFDVARAAWVADYNDPQNFLYLLETRTGPNNYGQFSNPEFDRLMMEQAPIRDQAERMELMHQAEKIAIDEDAWIPIYYYVSKALVSPKLKGYVDNTKHTHRSRWMSLEG